VVEMICDLCGKESEDSYKAVIEGTEMNVCANCARFGRVVSKKTAPVKQEKHPEFERRIEKPSEITDSVIPGFYKKIRERREQMNLTQEDFAKILSIKESMLHKIETGDFIPAIELARKIEHVLKIKIVERVEEKPEHVSGQKNSGNAMTIGDMIKIKEKK
jgi:putative transcription factor